MWVVAGVLLGLFVMALAAGFHTGPHTHLGAVVLGVVTGVWLLVMILQGRPLATLLALLVAVVLVTAGAGFLAWQGMRARPRDAVTFRARSVEGAEGVAVTDLDPDGIVRVRGEDWSARSANGTVRHGGRVQVLGAKGVHLEVWGEDEGATPSFPAERDQDVGEEH
jgi:membrane-bound serine protease (ClpP class)